MKRFLLVLTSLAALGGCAAVGSDAGGKVLAQIDDIATGAGQTRPAIVELNGKPALLYATKDNRIIFQHGEQRLPLDETAPVRGGNRFQLQLQDKQLHALWWSHQDAKNLYFTSSADGGRLFAPVSIVNDSHGVLPAVSLLRGPQGVVGITYQDERLPRFQNYFNRSTDYGRTWPKPDVRLDLPPDAGQPSDVHDPQSVESGPAWVSAWADAVKVAGRFSYRIVSRRSDDAGLRWSPPEVIYSSEKLISSLVVRAQGDHIVIAADEHGSGIVAFASQDQGRSWRSAGVLAGTGFAAGAEGASNSGIDLTMAAGRAHLAWMQDRKSEKTRIMRASLNVADSKWLGAVQRLDTKAHDNTRSLLPVLLAVPQGPVLAAWVDYRDIRPNIYLSASFDQGQAWSAPQALLKPAEMAAGWPKLIPWGNNQAAIAYDVYPTGRETEGKVVLRQIALAEGAKALPEFARQPEVNEAERKSRLAERVKTLWDNRVAGNYEPTYDFFDFAYKASTPKKNYLENVGVITYQSFTVDDLAIAGNEAMVKMKIKYEVKTTPMLGGKSITLAPAEVEATNTWVWVGNDWYLLYSPAFGQADLKY
ncbi:MAG: sialidase family protein [Polaromonas sp.]